MRLADADVAVGVDDAGKDAGPARDHLRPLLDRFHLRPLHHRLDARAEAPLLARPPNLGDVPIERLVLLELRTFERRVLAVAADDGEVVVLHRRAVLP